MAREKAAMGRSEGRQMGNESHCHPGVTQAGEEAVQVVLGRFMLRWSDFRGDPTNEKYTQAKKALEEINRLLERQKKGQAER